MIDFHKLDFKTLSVNTRSDSKCWYCMKKGAYYYVVSNKCVVCRCDIHKVDKNAFKNTYKLTEQDVFALRVYGKL